MRIFGTTLGRTGGTGVGILALMAIIALACGGGGKSGSSGDVADTGTGDPITREPAQQLYGPGGPGTREPAQNPVGPGGPGTRAPAGSDGTSGSSDPTTEPPEGSDEASTTDDSGTADDTDYVVVLPDGPGGLNLDSSNPDTVATETSPPTLILVNDLYNQQGLGDFNGIISVRIGSYVPVVGAECNSVNNSNTERLNPWSALANVADGNLIQPGYTNPTSVHSEAFGVSGFAGGDYCVFIQAGWWDYVVPPYFGDPYWAIHPTAALGCDGVSQVYKANVFKVNDHTAGVFEVKVSDFLPHIHWPESDLCQ